MGKGSSRQCLGKLSLRACGVLGWQYPGEHRALGIISAGQWEKQGLWVRLFGEKFRIREEYQCQHWTVQLDLRIVQVEKEGSGTGMPVGRDREERIVGRLRCVYLCQPMSLPGLYGVLDYSTLKFTLVCILCRWQTLIGGLLLHVSWKLGWAEINSSSR